MHSNSSTPSLRRMDTDSKLSLCGREATGQEDKGTSPLCPSFLRATAPSWLLTCRLILCRPCECHSHSLCRWWPVAPGLRAAHSPPLCSRASHRMAAGHQSLMRGHRRQAENCEVALEALWHFVRLSPLEASCCSLRAGANSLQEPGPGNGAQSKALLPWTTGPRGPTQQRRSAWGVSHLSPAEGRGQVTPVLGTSSDMP